MLRVVPAPYLDSTKSLSFAAAAARLSPLLQLSTGSRVLRVYLRKEQKHQCTRQQQA